MTKIAVVIPVRNAEKTLRRSIESIFNQSLLQRPDHEIHVILVYNGCTDGSEELGHLLSIEAACEKQGWMQSYICVHELKMPEDQKGIVPALNFGLFHAQKLGVDFIARQDADDCWYPQKLEIQLLQFQRHPEVDVCGTQIQLVSKEDFVPLSVSNNPIADHQIRQFLMAGSNPIAHPTVLFKPRVLNCAGVYDDLFPMAEDLWLWMKISKAGFKFTNTTEVLVDYTSTTNPNYTPLSPQLASHTIKQILNTFKR